MNEKVYNAKITPKSKKTEIILEKETFLIKVHSPPEKGKANEECIKAVKNYFKSKGIKVNAQIISGHTSRNKRIKVEFYD